MEFIGALATALRLRSASSVLEGHPCGIADEHEIKDVGIWWQAGDALLHLVKGKIVVVAEVDPPCE